MKFLSLAFLICMAQLSGAVIDKALPGVRSAFSSPSQIDQDLAVEILAMAKEDQTARINNLKQNHEAVCQIDQQHHQRLKEIVSTVGWPGIRLVGIEASSAMWLLVQHQDQDLEFQKQCLQLLKEAVENQDAGYREYAYLLDRVRKNENLPQVYGTQWIQKGDKFSLYPCEDPENLNQRRLEAGLGSMEGYKELMKKVYHFNDTDFEEPL